MEKNPSSSIQSFSQVIKNKGFLNLWLNQIMVQLAYNSLNFALIIWTYQLSNSNLIVSLLIFSIYLPAVIFGLFAGIIVDLTDRRKIIISIDILLVFLFLILLVTKSTIGIILIVAFLVNTLAQFYMPSESSAIPLIVKKNQLLTANSLFSITLFTTFLIGFGLSGPLIDLWGIDIVFAFGVFILLIAFLLAFNLPKICSRPDQSAKQILRVIKEKNFATLKNLTLIQIKETLSLIRGKLSVLFAIFILSGVQAVIAVLAVIIPSFFEKVLQINVTNGSYILIIPLGIGMIIGGLVIGKIGHLFPKRTIVSVSVLIAGLLIFAVGAAPLISPAIEYLPRPRPLPFTTQPALAFILTLGSFLVGMALVSVIIPSQTILQQNTTESKRGQVFSVLGVFMSGLALIPTILVGFLSDLFGTMPIFIAIGGIVALLGFLGLKPDFFFDEKHLPLKIRIFMGIGHWK